MTPEQRRARAYAAKALLDDETIKEGWALIEKDILDAWINSGGGWGKWFAQRRRERLWIELRAVKQLRQYLANFAAQGRE
jgi:hypothetical protein